MQFTFTIVSTGEYQSTAAARVLITNAHGVSITNQGIQIDLDIDDIDALYEMLGFAHDCVAKENTELDDPDSYNPADFLDPRV